jgi:excisionase family DNA binding protein
MTEPGTLPKLYSIDEAAEPLGISKYTVRREIDRKRLGFTWIGGRRRITDDQILEYLNNGRVDPSHEGKQTDPGKSATAGSPSGQIVRSGAELGSTQSLDRHAAHRSAQQIFKRPSCASPNGSSKIRG